VASIKELQKVLHELSKEPILGPLKFKGRTSSWKSSDRHVCSLLFVVINKIHWCVAICAVNCAVVIVVVVRTGGVTDQIASDFCLPHSTPLLWGSLSKYCYNVWYGKTRIVWLPICAIFFKDIFIRVDKIHERDRRADRRTNTAWRHSDSCGINHAVLMKLGTKQHIYNSMTIP